MCYSKRNQNLLVSKYNLISHTSLCEVPFFRVDLSRILVLTTECWVIITKLNVEFAEGLPQNYLYLISIHAKPILNKKNINQWDNIDLLDMFFRAGMLGHHKY